MSSQFEQVDQWFEIQVVNQIGLKNNTKSKDGANNIEHPMVASLATRDLNKFLNPKEELQDFIILSLFHAPKSTNQKSPPKYSPGQREIFIQVRTDAGAGVNIDDENDNGPNNTARHVITVSNAFASLHGIINGDLARLRRIRDKNARLSTALLLPLPPDSGLSEQELKHSLLTHGHIICQGGIVLLPKKPAGYNVYYVLDCAPILQGILTRSSTVALVNENETSEENQKNIQEVIQRILSSGQQPQEDLAKAIIMSTPLANSVNANSPQKPLVVSSFMLPLSSSKPRITPPPTPPRRPEDEVPKTSYFSPAKSAIEKSTLSPLKSPGSSLDASITQSLINDTTTVKLQVQQLLDPLENPQPTPPFRDINYEVGVTMKTMKALQLFSGSWILIQSADGKQKHIGRIYVLDPPALKNPRRPSLITTRGRREKKQVYQDFTLYLSTIMMFNLGVAHNQIFDNQNRITVTVQDVSRQVNYLLNKRDYGKDNNNPNKKPSFNNVVEEEAMSESLISFATDIKISRVITPQSSGFVSYTSALKNYFSTPKLLKTNDVIAIPIRIESFNMLHNVNNISHVDTIEMDSDSEDELDSQMGQAKLVNTNEISDRSIHTQLIYFKVTRLETKNKQSEFGLVKIDVGTMYQEGASNSKIPPLIKSFMKLDTFPHSPPGYGKAYAELCSIVKPCLHPLSATLGITCSVLISGPSGIGKTTLVHSASNYFGVHLMEINCYDLVGQTDAHTEQNVKSLFKEAVDYIPAMLLLKHIQAFQPDQASSSQGNSEPAVANTLKECIQSLAAVNKENNNQLLVIGTTDSLNDISRTVRNCFRHEIKLETPDDKQRSEILTYLCSELTVNKDVSIRDLSIRTASFTPRDLHTLVTNAGAVAINRVLAFVKNPKRITLAQEELDSSLTASEKDEDELLALQRLEEEITAAGVAITLEDFDKALLHLQGSASSKLGAPKIPNVKWEDVGGLIEAKKEILDTIQLPLEHPELFASGLRQRSGILLYGPPGTGKTLLAKAVATECSLNFISVKGPELINMYVGESEKNVRDVFQRARDAKPCVIFFDELDSLAPNRGRASDSGGVMDRVVSQLLAELSALNEGGDVFVIGATNRPDLIDPALLVPGRFDKLLYLGISEDKTSQLRIIKALTRKFNMAPNTSLEKIAEACPNNLTGADFYALCSDAMLNAIRDQVNQLEQLYETNPELISEYKKGNKSAVVQVEEKHFIEALNNLTPSVSKDELERYKQLRDKFTQKR